MATTQEQIASKLYDYLTYSYGQVYSFVDNCLFYNLSRMEGDGSLVPPEYDFTNAPNDTDNLTLKKDKMFDIGDSAFPTFSMPNKPTFEDLSAYNLHRERIWISSEMDTLINIIGDMASGSTGWFSPQYQQNLFDHDLDRKLQALDDALRMAAAKHASRGFRMPTSFFQAQENELYQKYYFDRNNQSREIIKIVEEAARDFMKTGVEKGLTYEQLNMQFTEAFDKLFIEKSLAMIDSYIKEVDAEIRRFEGEMRGIIARIEAEKAAWQLTGEYNKMIIDADMHPWNKYKIQTESEVARARLDFDTWSQQVTADLQALVHGMSQAVQMMASTTTSDISVTQKK